MMLHLVRAFILACAAGLAAAAGAPPAGAEEAPAPASAEVSGTVVGPGGEPAAGAIVAVVLRNRADPAAVAVSDARGAFSATVPPGTYALTATHPQWTAAYSPPAEASGKAVRDLRLLAPAEGFLLAGEVRDSTGAALGGAQVRCMRSFLRSDLFVVHADGAGRYALRLPAAPHVCRAVAGEARSAHFEVAAGGGGGLDPRPGGPAADAARRARLRRHGAVARGRRRRAGGGAR
ncbi:MAG TPA: carboxypeptidase-like regulatory domain-containing protein [Thermoanaerobaculia bacterium]|nr:carboxypeptidase-like regulatory domain-containing protein [Thermoanaerobaculia bacterium]